MLCTEHRKASNDWHVEHTNFEQAGHLINAELRMSTEEITNCIFPVACAFHGIHRRQPSHPGVIPSFASFGRGTIYREHEAVIQTNPLRPGPSYHAIEALCLLFRKT